MTKTDVAKETEIIERQISWLRVYCLELNILEQPGMPMERHQKTMALRDEAPQFFWLVSSLLKDALIMGLDSLLDGDKRGVQLTLEHIVKRVADPVTRKTCEVKLVEIRKGAGCRELAIARNHLIAHPNRETLSKRDQMSVKENFPTLTISGLEAILREMTELAGLALGKLPSEFSFQDWKGASKLFMKLQQIAG